MSRLTTFRAALGCTALLGFAALPAHAQIGITLDAGSTGAGVHLVAPLGQSFNARLGANYIGYDFEQRSGEIDYQLDGKLQTVDLLVDWYPGAGSFRITGGAVYNGNRFDAVGNADRAGTYTIDGRQYIARDVGTINGTVSFRKAAPYLGIGWGNALNADKRLNFSAELGAFYQGKARTKLESVNCAAGTALCSALARDLKAEELRLSEDASDYKFFPVLRASVSYRF
ncbi:hypothetical protein [Massilia sp. AB1]|uniref:hypothetical protein n=1 Tax=Massilia sp. AB1 TaxID=2823371 RepID=UPI001B832168|nr:hypothetical protein [Massilia sp. AB1]MBQ5939795.1 hypothetical protein [Massilia sp. AB1]